jgi:hypothetical protein
LDVVLLQTARTQRIGKPILAVAQAAHLTAPGVRFSRAPTNIAAIQSQ